MDDLHLFIYGEIGGESFFEEPTISVDEIQQKLLDNPKAKEVIVHISSPGGGVFDGWTIGNIIKNSGLKSTAKIEGLCASIATFVALSCDRVEMADTARFMIHNPWNVIQGEETDLEEAAEQLAKIKDDLLRIYKNKTGLSVVELSKMMDEETTLTAVEAKDKGFIDGFMVPMKAVAKLDIKNTKMKSKKEIEQEKETLSVMDKILAKADELYKRLTYQDSAHNVMLTLADGSAIFVESEDGELEGKNAFTVDEEGNPTDTPVEDGTHALEDGRSITVEGGVVVSVQEEDAEVDDLKQQVATLEKEISDNQSKNEEGKKEKEETEKNVKELILEVKNLKTMTAGDNASLKKPVIEPVNKFNANKPAQGHPMDGFAASMKRLRNKTI